MKKITFGFNNDINPTGQFEGIGIKPGLLLCKADYYGAIGYKDSNYIVAKVVQDEFNRYPDLLNKFIVRQALCDIYADGSAVLMLNQDENIDTQYLEEYLNNLKRKDEIKNITDIYKCCEGVTRAQNAFVLPELGRDEILATSIRTEEFYRKLEAIKNCHNSISELQLQINNVYTR